MARKQAIVALVALCAALSLTGPGLPAHAGVSALDPTFGAGGKILTDFGGVDGIEDVAVQRDGKIVAVGTQNQTASGSEFLARYDNDGTLDSSFGAGGKVTTGFTAPYAVALQDDGRIVAAGSTGSGPTHGDFALARYNADGSLDPTFGDNGKVVTDFNSTIDYATGLAIQPDGKIVAAGSTRPFGPYDANPPDFALARYNSNGSLDSTFGGDGKISTEFTAGWADHGYGIALAPGRKIVVAGWGLPNGAGGPGVIDVARYNTDGSLDPDFDGDGRVVSTPGTDNGAFAVITQPDGRVVVAGFVDFDLALVRYTASGSLDSSFGLGGGVARGSRGAAYDLVRQPDGKLAAVGAVGSEFAVARFTTSGTLDRSFYGGAISTDFGAYDTAEAVALQSNGKIVAGGSSAEIANGFTTAEDSALARYLGRPPCKVPNVRGRKLAVARSAITKAHCRLGKVRRRASQTVKPGRVISQRPRAGKTLPNWSRVNLVVSRGRR
jgi:uncharacterized delta-60 repeat protein